MQGRKDLSPKIMYQVHLDMLVPQDNFYRKLDAALNLHFLYKATSKYYGSEGNESIDPVVFFKIILVGYFNNINSDRQLLRLPLSLKQLDKVTTARLVLSQPEPVKRWLQD
jgi:transposase